jgi:hypothetical protein
VEARRLGEEWPPQRSPCEACDGEDKGGGGGGGAECGGREKVADIEDVVGGGGSGGGGGGGGEKAGILNMKFNPWPDIDYADGRGVEAAPGRGLHSSTFQLNLRALRMK